MKKFNIFITLIFMTVLLSACQLAKEIDTENVVDNVIQTVYYPVELNFEIVDKDTNQQSDVSEYYYFSWLDDPEILSFESIGSHLGKSMLLESSALILSGSTNITLESEFTLYFNKEYQGDVIYYSVNSMSNQGETKTDYFIGAVIGNGLTLTYKGYIVSELNQGFTLDLTMHVVVLDELQYVTIKEFNSNDEVINTTISTIDQIVTDITVQSETQYVIIIETFSDESEGTYQERKYYNILEGTQSYKYKFFDDNGYIMGSLLNIHQ